MSRVLTVPAFAKPVRQIGTHHGVFHCDDVMAAAILRLAYPACEIVRTRDPAKLASCDIVFDVGGLYDPSKGRYDHHQVGRAGTYLNGIEYSSAGLVWAAFGNMCALESRVRELVAQRLMMPIDALDNGQELAHICDGETRVSDSELRIGSKFDNVPPFAGSFSSAISLLNPCWYERGHANNESYAFETAMDFAQLVLERQIASAQGQVQAEASVRMAVETARGEFLELTQALPWQEIVIAETTETKFVVFPSETGEWMVQCVPDALGSFGKRKALPQEWAGLRGSALQEITGVKDAIFSHPGSFICGAKSREGAVKLAKLALASSQA